MAPGSDISFQTHTHSFPVESLQCAARVELFPQKPAMLPFYLLTFAATIQAHSQLLPGSCNFESNTCEYTSDADFASWTLHEDGSLEVLALRRKSFDSTVEQPGAFDSWVSRNLQNNTEHLQ
ncbi:MAM domain-containing protein 2-like protein, partial [Lates japonicus]